jgi:hypothetical protein
VCVKIIKQNKMLSKYAIFQYIIPFSSYEYIVGSEIKTIDQIFYLIPIILKPTNIEFETAGNEMLIQTNTNQYRG